MKKLLPQANTLDTVIRTFRFASNKNNCTLGDIANFIQFRVRQAAYYSNACFFLGLLDDNLEPTDLGRKILEEGKDTRKRIYEVIISHELIGRLFAKTALLPQKVAIKEGKKIVKDLYPEYGDAVIDRRTKCLIGWCKEILDYIKSQHELLK